MREATIIEVEVNPEFRTLFRKVLGPRLGFLTFGHTFLIVFFPYPLRPVPRQAHLFMGRQEQLTRKYCTAKILFILGPWLFERGGDCLHAAIEMAIENDITGDKHCTLLPQNPVGFP